MYLLIDVIMQNFGLGDLDYDLFISVFQFENKFKNRFVIFLCKLKLFVESFFLGFCFVIV